MALALEVAVAKQLLKFVTKIALRFLKALVRSFVAVSKDSAKWLLMFMSGLGSLQGTRRSLIAFMQTSKQDR